MKVDTESNHRIPTVTEMFQLQGRAGPRTRDRVCDMTYEPAGDRHVFDRDTNVSLFKFPLTHIYSILFSRKKIFRKKLNWGKNDFCFFLVSPFLKKFEGIRASKVVQLLSLVVKRTSRSKPRLKTGSHELEAEQQVWRELTRATRG